MIDTAEIEKMTNDDCQFLQSCLLRVESNRCDVRKTTLMAFLVISALFFFFFFNNGFQGFPGELRAEDKLVQDLEVGRATLRVQWSVKDN